MLYNRIKHILPEFAFEGRYLDGEELHSGNINNTYHLIYGTRDGAQHHYTLQQINSYAFRDPAAVMRNIEMISTHMRSALEEKGVNPDRRMLEIIPTRKGETMLATGNGGFWRAYKYIENATAYNQVTKPEHFFETGRAFGEFQRLLMDFPAEKLNETIPNFHNTQRRFYTFVASIAEDKVGRVKELEDEIEFFFERRKMMSEIVRKLEAGDLPIRVTHNDTKINNVMIDNETDKAICVIDLDTVMPGSALYDYGDAIRSGANTAAEDEPDTDKIALDLNLFEQFTRGFLSEVHDILTDEEIRLMPLSIKVITCELAMRFLTDYIDGDLYFKVHSPDHNLIRARAQMKLLTDIEDKYDELNEMVQKIVSEFKN